MKKIIALILLIISVVLITIGFRIMYLNYQEDKKNKQIITDIINSYSDYVKITNKKSVYIKNNDDYKEIGYLYKDTEVALVNKNVTSKDDIYYQIKGTDYYIDYLNMEKINNITFDNSFDNYLIGNTIKANPIKLYQDGILKIELNDEYNFDVYFIDNNKYYVKYLDQIYYIEGDYELTKKDNTDILTSISVLALDTGISNDKMNEILKYLKDNNYESISLQEFIYWINGNISLTNNKVLLIANSVSEDNKKIIDNYQYRVNTDLNNINFISGDIKLNIGDTKYYKYVITNDISINRVSDMLNGIKEKKKETGIAVLNYHFFYDGSSGEQCNESICLDVSNFRKQLSYLKDNNYKVLTMSEFNDWMDRKIILPDKSVLITIDDGAMGTSFINGNKIIPILEEYQMPATLFLITGWWDASNYRSNYLELQSHGDELHHNNYCRNGKCSYKGLMLSKEEIVADLQISINKLGTNLAFCYPFYQKNNTMIEALKDTGFKLAFSGGNRKAKQTDNKYNIPRYVVYKNTSLDSFIKMVK